MKEALGRIKRSISDNHCVGGRMVPNETALVNISDLVELLSIAEKATPKKIVYNCNCGKKINVNDHVFIEGFYFCNESCESDYYRNRKSL